MSEINNIEELPEVIFPNNLRLIDQYQRNDPIPMAKYCKHIYRNGSFHGISNINLNLIICRYQIFIPSILQSYLLHWFHKYLLRLEIDRTEAIIFQHLY